MRKSVKLLLEQSEKRQRLNELLAIESGELTDEQRAEMDSLTKRMTQIEVELRAALTSEADAEARAANGCDDSDPEARALQALIGRAGAGRILDAVIDHRAASGAESELQQHLGLAANQIPLALLRFEERAATPAPATVGTEQHPIIPGVFPQACAAFLGIDMPMVPVGEAVFPVLTTNAAVHAPAEAAAAAETTGAFSAEALAPKRLQASFYFSREDRARFAGMEESLRMNLGDALADALDKQVLAGPDGLFAGANLANNDAAAVTKFADYLSEFGYSRVDGTFANTTADLRIVAGSPTFAHMGKSYRSDEADYNAVDALMRITGGVKVSAHVPAATAADKQNAVVRLGMRRDMVAPVWDGVTLIPDEITKAATGQIVITAIMLHAVKILRAGGFRKQQTQHA